MFTTVLTDVGFPLHVIVAEPNVSEIGKIKPDLLVCDVDRAETDPLEMLRQLRFVLPSCVIVVYTDMLKRSWSIACHLAGANGLLSRASSDGELALGIRDAVQDGCFTDPRFAAA